MYPNTKSARDPFTFSLYGIRAVNSHFMVPAIADQGINMAWRARHEPRSGHVPPTSHGAVARQIEAVLARYFAPGCCNAG